MKKNINKKALIAIIAVVVFVIATIVFFLVSGAGNKDDKTSAPSQNTVVNEEKEQGKEPAKENGEAAKEPEEEGVKGKYSDNEVYTGDDGKEYSKTEDGTEVEITGDNLQTLIDEYQKVEGTGSEREKELLDQIQVIMDIVSARTPQ